MKILFIDGHFTHNGWLCYRKRGKNVCGTYYNDTWGWDGIDWIQEFPEDNPSGRRNYAMAYDSKRDAVVLFGGYNGDFLGDTWEY